MDSHDLLLEQTTRFIQARQGAGQGGSKNTLSDNVKNNSILLCHHGFCLVCPSVATM